MIPLCVMLSGTLSTGDNRIFRQFGDIVNIQSAYNWGRMIILMILIFVS